MVNQEPVKNDGMPKPHVQIFGSDINENTESREESRKRIREERRERQNREHRCGNCNSCRCGGNDGGGLIFLTGGVILLLNTFGVLPWDFWNYVWPFWPILLILVGVRLLLGHGWFSGVISSLLTLFALAFVVSYALIHLGPAYSASIPPQFTNFINSIKF